jgi:hypothetical protein
MRGYGYNDFKLELTQRCVTTALESLGATA